MDPKRVAEEIGDDSLFADGFDEALVGYVERFGVEPMALYDRTKYIEILARDMTYDEAVEHFEFNVIGAWVGEKTPAFATFLSTPKKVKAKRKK